jgi:hypothetical protein
VRRASARPAKLERQHHVLERGERGNQVEGLEDEADALRPQACAAVLVKLREILAIEQHTPAAGHVETREQRQQRRLARPRGPLTATDSPARISRETVIDNSQRTFRAANLLGEVFSLENVVADQRRLGRWASGCCSSRSKTRWPPPERSLYSATA